MSIIQLRGWMYPFPAERLERAHPDSIRRRGRSDHGSTCPAVGSGRSMSRPGCRQAPRIRFRRYLRLRSPVRALWAMGQELRLSAANRASEAPPYRSSAQRQRSHRLPRPRASRPRFSISSFHSPFVCVPYAQQRVSAFVPTLRRCRGYAPAVCSIGIGASESRD
jgi:hypothetical protein